MIGLNHDAVLNHATRGFPRIELFPQIRQRPSLPLLKVLKHRLAQNPADILRRRISISQNIAASFPQTCIVGKNTKYHSHWVLPIQATQPERLLNVLWKEGFDATRKGSNMSVVKLGHHQKKLTPSKATTMMENIVFLPLHPSITESNAKSIGRIVKIFHAGEQDEGITPSPCPLQVNHSGKYRLP